MIKGPTVLDKARLDKDRALLDQYSVTVGATLKHLYKPFLSGEMNNREKTTVLCDTAGDLIVASASLILSTRERLLAGHFQLLDTRERIGRSWPGGSNRDFRPDGMLGLDEP